MRRLSHSWSSCCLLQPLLLQLLLCCTTSSSSDGDGGADEQRYRIQLAMHLGEFDQLADFDDALFIQALSVTGGARRSADSGIPSVTSVAAFDFGFGVSGVLVKVSFRQQTAASKDLLVSDLSMMGQHPANFESAWAAAVGGPSGKT